jgi:hypothetical protein
MKYQALSHHKFRRLHSMLGLRSTAYTAGHLELIWCHAHTTQPEIKRVEVEHIADWCGDEEVLLNALIECGWLDIVNESTVQVHDYADHAPSYVKKRDYQKDYMREYRKRNELLGSVRPNTSNVSTNKTFVRQCKDVLEPVSVPTIHNHTIHISSKEDNKEGDTPNTPASSSAIFFYKWNEMAKQCSIPECVETETRKKTLRTRMKEKHFKENWQAALEKVKESSFCNGRNERLWKANVEWFLKPDTVAKILEGKYDFEFQQPGKPPPAMSRECMRPEDNVDIFGTPTTKEKSK